MSGIGPGSLSLVNTAELGDIFSAIKWKLARGGGAVVHYAGVEVDPELLLLLSDRAIYLYSVTGVFVRCLEVKKIEEVVRHGTVLGLRVPSEYDLRLHLDATECDRFLRPLTVIYNRTTDKPLLVREVGSDEELTRNLWLTPPGDWSPRPELPFHHDGANTAKQSVAEELLGKQREIDRLRRELSANGAGEVGTKLAALERAVSDVAGRLQNSTPPREPTETPHHPISTPGTPHQPWEGHNTHYSGGGGGGGGGGGIDDSNASVRVLARRLSRQVAAATQELAHLKSSQTPQNSREADNHNASLQADVVNRLATLEGLLRENAADEPNSPDNEVLARLQKMEGYVEGRVHEAATHDTATPSETAAPGKTSLNVTVHQQGEKRPTADTPSKEARKRTPFWGGNSTPATGNQNGRRRSSSRNSPRYKSMGSMWANTPGSPQSPRRGGGGGGGGGGSAQRRRDPRDVQSERAYLRKRSAAQESRQRQQRRGFDWGGGAGIPEVESVDYPSQHNTRCYRCVTEGQYHTLRASPATDAEKVGELSPGDVVDVVATFTDPDGLCWVKLSDGAWCLSGYDDEEDCYMMPDSPRNLDVIASSVATLEDQINRKMAEMGGQSSNKTDLKRLQQQVQNLEESLEVKTGRIHHEMTQQRELLASELKKLRPTPNANSIQLMPTNNNNTTTTDPTIRHLYPMSPTYPDANYSNDVQDRNVSPPRPREGAAPTLNEQLWGSPHRQTRSLSPPDPEAAMQYQFVQQTPATPVHIVVPSVQPPRTPTTTNVPGHWRITTLNAIVRAEHDMTSRQVAVLPQAEVVEVAEVVGTRARVVTPVRGWVSTVGETGARLMVPSAAVSVTPSRTSYAPQTRRKQQRDSPATKSPKRQSPRQSRHRTPPPAALSQSASGLWGGGGASSVGAGGGIKREGGGGGGGGGGGVSRHTTPEVRTLTARTRSGSRSRPVTPRSNLSRTRSNSRASLASRAPFR